MRGDANLDGLVDVGDCVMILRFVSGDSSANVKDQGKLNGDVNGSGNLDDGDADRILKFIARLIDQV